MPAGFLSQSQPKEEAQPILEIVGRDSATRCDQEGSHCWAESVTGEHDDSRDRPSTDVLDRRRNLFFCATLSILRLALDAEALPRDRFCQHDIDASFRAPESPAKPDLSSRLETELSGKLLDLSLEVATGRGLSHQSFL